MNSSIDYSWQLEIIEILRILVMINSLQHSANGTSYAVIMVAVLINRLSVMATMIALMGVMNLSYATVQAILIW